MTQQKQNEQPLHVTIAVGNWKNYRVFRTCEALHKYVQAILNKGYKAFLPGKHVSPIEITSWNAMCEEVFNQGITLRKTGIKEIRVSETAKASKKTPSKKTTKSKPGLSAPIAIPDEGYRNWTLVEEDVTYDKTKYKRFQSHEDALYAFTLRYQALEDAGYFRKSLKLDGTAKWEGEYINAMENRETIKLMIV